MSICCLPLNGLKAFLALSLLAALGTAHAQQQPSEKARAFADRMITCNSHALLLFMFAQGEVPDSVPARAQYRDIAYAAAGEGYVAERLISEDEMQKALKELEPLLNAQSQEGMSEPQKDEYTYAAWSKIIKACNQSAAAQQ